jgi:acetylornithine/succinyldiaminopimelate/putrescine aminotransferase
MQAALNPTVKAMLAALRSDRAFVRGQGTRLFDAAGREYLDCWAQYGVLALGHNPPAVVEAVRAALAAGTPAFLQPYRAPHAEALAEELVRRAPPGLAHAVFTNSGAEAVEAAVKLCRAATGKTRILSAEGSYHGSTFAAMAASGQPDYRHGFGPLPAGFETVPYGDADALEARLAAGARDIAAFMVEPIQGRRGAHAPPPGYLAAARASCTRHGVALIADEIQTGLGRTGTLFACEREAVAPDVLLVAKALGGGLYPLGACLATAALWNDDFAVRHLSTFANNNLACLAGVVTLRELDALLPALPDKAARLRAALSQLARRHPATVRETRAHGLLAALDLHPPPPEAGPALAELQRRGLYASVVAAALAELESVLVLPAVGEANVLRFIPPLIMTASEIDRGVDGIDRILTRLERSEADVLRAVTSDFR